MTKSLESLTYASPLLGRQFLGEVLFRPDSSHLLTYSEEVPESGVHQFISNIGFAVVSGGGCGGVAQDRLVGYESCKSR